LKEKNGEQRPTTMVSSGAFRYVRHPLYLGSILIYLGFTVSKASLLCLGLLVVIVVFYNSIAAYEEKLLEVKFGKDKAQKIRVDILCLGLGYTAVVTSDGGIGIAYTYFEGKKSCMLLNEDIDYEGRQANYWKKKLKVIARLIEAWRWPWSMRSTMNMRCSCRKMNITKSCLNSLKSQREQKWRWSATLAH
jgi:hypothetical protein